MVRLLPLCLASLLAAPAMLRGPQVVRSAAGIPAEIAGRFREPYGFQQAASGQYFVFDRRAHAVFGIDESRTSVWEIVKIGPEAGNIIEPTAFSLEPNGTFAVADAPNNRDRIQIFTPAGFRTGGFTLPGRSRPRVVLGTLVLNGVGTLQYTGRSILMSQPESGGLITEYGLAGSVVRTIGELRATGHEDDRDLHLALNSGLPLVDPLGGFYFVFQTGVPLFRKYDAEGRLVFERHIEGREIDEIIARLPTHWPRRRDDDVPLVSPTITTAAVDPSGGLWVSLATPFSYVYDRDGDKSRTIQLRGAGVLKPTSFFFGRNGRLLVTPGLYEFDVQ